LKTTASSGRLAHPRTDRRARSRRGRKDADGLGFCGFPRRPAGGKARELAPKGVHVAHFVIDGGIRSAERPDDPQKPDALLDPDAIAKSYLAMVDQPRSAWTWEIELRPWVETF
jgi:hypothetical protein